MQRKPRWRRGSQSPSWEPDLAQSAARELPGLSPNWSWPRLWWWHSHSYRWHRAMCGRLHTPAPRTWSNALSQSPGSCWRTADQPRTSWASGWSYWQAACVHRLPGLQLLHLQLQRPERLVAAVSIIVVATWFEWCSSEKKEKKSQVSQVKGINVKVCIHAGWKGTKCEMHTLLTPADKQKNECWQMLIRSKREEKGWRLDFLMLFALQCLKGSLCIFTLSDDVMMCLLTFGHKNMNLVCCLPNK